MSTSSHDRSSASRGRSVSSQNSSIRRRHRKRHERRSRSDNSDKSSRISSDFEDNVSIRSGSESENDTMDANDDMQLNQELLNDVHPFGLKIWKPSLYKKYRSIETDAEEALLGDPIYRPTRRPLWALFGNILYTLTFGWILALLYAVVGLLLLVFWGTGGILYFLKCPDFVWWPFERCGDYAAVLFNLSLYVFFPFGKQVERIRLTAFIQDAIDGPQSKHVFLDPEVFSLPKKHDLPIASVSQTPLVTTFLDSPLDQSRFLDDSTPLMVDYEDRQDNYSHRRRRDEEEGDESEDEVIVPQRSWMRRLFGLPAYTIITPQSVLFRFLVLVLIAPIQLIVVFLCWLGVVTIPTAQLHWVLLRHLIRTPLRIRSRSPSCPPLFLDSQQAVLSQVHAEEVTNAPRPFHTMRGSLQSAFRSMSKICFGTNEMDLSEDADMAREAEREREKIAEMIICAYFAVNTRFLKYTVDGINVVIVNLLIVPLITIFVGIVLPHWGIEAPASLTFVLALISTIPCSYFIGQSVASITASTGSLALGAVINATFGSIVEVILYCFAIAKGQDQIVQGSIIGSFLLGLLGLPGIAMFSSGLIRKVSKFNVKAAGVTVTLLLFTVVAVFTPTIFHMVYASWEFACGGCSDWSKQDLVAKDLSRCRNCRFWQPHPRVDPFYYKHTEPLMLICCACLLFTYAVGLLYSLRTHERQIYQQKKRQKQRKLLAKKRKMTDSQFLPSSKPPILPDERNGLAPTRPVDLPLGRSPRLAPLQPKVLASFKRKDLQPIDTVTPRDLLGIRPEPQESPMQQSFIAETISIQSSSSSSSLASSSVPHGPSWTRTKSVLALLLMTCIFAAIAEVLVDSVDAVSGTIGPKFLGLTVFAIAPSASEMYNAVAFAMSRQMQLSMEIANAYTSQVAMLQIPIVVFFSTWWAQTKRNTSPLSGFTLVFPRQDALSVFLAVFLLAYVYIEGKATYFKGVCLMVSYLVLLAGFYFVPPNDVEGSSLFRV